MTPEGSASKLPEFFTCSHSCQSEKGASNSLFCKVCTESISSLQNAIEQLEQTRDTMIRLCLKKHRKSSHEEEAPQLNLGQFAELGTHH